MKILVKLSDKILLIFIFFASILVVAVTLFFGGSLIQIIVFSGFIYIVSFLITFVISRNFSRKIMRLSFKVEEMAAGNLSKKLEVNSKDEIGQLTNSLNELISRLQTGVAVDVSSTGSWIKRKLIL